MASTQITLKGAKRQKESKMADPNVNPAEVEQDEVEEVVQADPSKFSGKVTRKIEHPLTGKDIKREGNYTVPQAVKTFEEALAIEKGIETDVLFWYNFGKKTQARAQLNAMLEFDLGSEKLNDLYSAFANARKNVVEKNSTEEEIKAANEWILGLPKFKELKTVFDELAVSGMNPINVQFGNGGEAANEVELKKPTGIKGRQKKEETTEAAAS